ncbi:gamma-glutamyltransferase [Pseudonocardia acaciae]|uniref:gamma-glutamyltransferase n=1 Tax=Pseudonocardia acaciae TaxID=551276 RepID=UPI000A410794|nr:gamma-glutamyltransferase [Pseudonocardia acaciae]
MPEVSTDGGVVVANDQRAADAGALMLSRGGNAVDAAVATAFALAVTEPFLSGLGGGAWIVGHHGPTAAPFEVAGAITAPAAARPDMFALAGSDDPVGFYGWPKVVDDANILGARSIGVPGAVAALCLAHRRLGALDLPTIMAPAISLAADGHEVDWLASALTTSAAPELARFESSAEVFLPGGLPLRGPVMGTGDLLRQPALARTLDAIAAGGAAAFYRGTVAERLAESIRELGGILSAADLADYRARWAGPTSVRIGDAELLGAPNTGFPTAVEMLHAMARTPPEQDPVVGWATAMGSAFRRRLEPAAARSGCTSHVTAADSAGTVVSLTQTVLDLFGSRYLEPRTGVLLNDGMLYFDPRPGRANSVRPGLAGLAAVTPMLVRRAGEPVAALGASGGRRIITAVAQVTHRLLAGQSITDALAAPRIHAESGTAWVDPRLGSAAPLLRERGWQAVVVGETPTTFPYARANGIDRRGEGWRAAADALKPYGLATEGEGRE